MRRYPYLKPKLKDEDVLFTFPSQGMVASIGPRTSVGWHARIGLSLSCTRLLTGASRWAQCTISCAVQLSWLGQSAAVSTSWRRIGATTRFQAGKPVLVGVDTASTYCYCLVWKSIATPTPGASAARISRSGLNPQATIADAGSSLRAGQAKLSRMSPVGAIFHIVRDLEIVVSFLENRRGAQTSELRERKHDRLGERGSANTNSKEHGTALHELVRQRSSCSTSDDVACDDWFARDLTVAVVYATGANCMTCGGELRAGIEMPHRLEPICRGENKGTTTR